MRHLFVLLLLVSTGFGCAFTKYRPCTDGGDPARVPSTGGTKQCDTTDDATGRPVNHGHYREWFLSGRLAIEGDYRMGKKHGKWTEWDESGKRLYEKFYEDGVEVPRFDAPPAPVAPPPAPAPAAVAAPASAPK